MNVQFGDFTIQSATYITRNYGFDDMPTISEDNIKLINNDGVKNISVIYNSKAMTFTGKIKGTTATGLETAIDNLKQAMAKERQNLDIVMADATTRRYKNVNVTNLSIGTASKGSGRDHYETLNTSYVVTFSAGDPMAYATSETTYKNSSAVTTFVTHDSITTTGTTPIVPNIEFFINSVTAMTSLEVRTGFYEGWEDSDDSDWTTTSGTWAISSNVMQQTASTAGIKKISYDTQLYDNFTYYASITLDSAGSDAGLIFGASDLTGASEDMYVMYISDTDNKIYLKKYVAGVASDLVRPFSIAIADSTEYQIKIEYDEQLKKLYGYYYTGTAWKQIFEVIESGIKGKFGFYTGATSTASFDNIYYYPLRDLRYVTITNDFVADDVLLLSHFTKDSGIVKLNADNIFGAGNYPVWYATHKINGSDSKLNYYTIVATSTAHDFDYTIKALPKWL